MTRLVIAPLYFYIAIILCITLMVLAVIYTGIYIYVKNLEGRKDITRKKIADILIERAIFSDEEQDNTDNSYYNGHVLVRNRKFRRILTAEILLAKKNFSGASAEQLRQMYLALRLDEYALKNLNNRRWYIKAKALQELGIMEMQDHMDIITPYANHPNELVRIEAQTAIVRLHGYKGLLFLDTVTYPISDWQQIKLLSELSIFRESQFFGDIENWLQSANHSVIIFVMRIVSHNHLFNIHDQIITCMDHENPGVRLQAIQTLNEIYTEYTTDSLKRKFESETHNNRLAILKVLKNIGTEKDIDFMFDYLENESNELKLSLIRTITAISDQKFLAMERFPRKDEYPWSEMIQQIKGGI